MAPAGFKSVEIAQQNGSWNLLDEVEALVIPDDLTQAFSRHEGSMEYFSGLSKSIKKNSGRNRHRGDLLNPIDLFDPFQSIYELSPMRPHHLKAHQE